MKVGMKKIILMFFALAALFSCSYKYEDINDELKIDSSVLKISASAGAMPFYVYYDGQWAAEIVGGCDWAQLRTTSGQGVTMIWMDYKANPLVSRSLVIRITGGGMTKEIKVTQNIGLLPSMTFEPATAALSQTGEQVQVKVLTNVNEKNIGLLNRKIVYGEGGEDWLTVGDFVRGEEEPVINTADTTYTYYVGLQATANSMGMNKAATVTWSVTDATGKEYPAMLNVQQTY
jgi:hypothetical protein